MREGKEKNSERVRGLEERGEEGRRERDEGAGVERMVATMEAKFNV